MKKNAKKLSLRIENVRNLRTPELTQAQGGQMDPSTLPGTGCPFHCWPDPPR